MKDGQNKRKGKKQFMLLYMGLLHLCLHNSLIMFLHSSYSKMSHNTSALVQNCAKS
jgi:hypothetical protein